MNLLILLFFGILGIVYATYKIPEYDACVLRVLLCDDLTKPLTPVDNSTLEMFKSIGQLNAVCDELSKFRICLKDAEKFCTEKTYLDVGLELLNNRRLAFDLCERGSAYQHVYMMVEECVNEYSHSAIEFCTDKAVETVGLDFYPGDYDRECRFLGAIQHCHIAVVTDQCGSIAGNMLEKLVVFRGERDFMCIGYEKEKLKNLEVFYDTMDSYVQQYRNTVHEIEIEIEDKDESTDETPPQEDSSQFYSRISSIPEEDPAYDTINGEELLNSGMPHCAEEKEESCLSDKSILDSECIAQNIAQPIKRFYEQKTDKVLSDENYACKTKTSFLLIEIRSNGERYLLGYGKADVLWATFSPLKDVSCGWSVDQTSPMPLARCSILIHNSVSRKEIKGKICDMPSNATIVVYETVNEKEMKRVANLKLRSFLKYSPTHKEKFDRVVSFFKNHAHDIRYWCAEQHETDLYKEPNRGHSTSRTGFISYDVHKYGMEGRQSGISNQKHIFYNPEQFEYPIDTEIHSISSERENLENEFDLGDDYASQNQDGNLKIFLTDEILDEKVYEPSTSDLSEPSKSSHSYRPYELYRPHVGETLKTEHPDMARKDLRKKDKRSFNPNVLFEDSSKTGYKSHLHAEEMCPEPSENISKLINKPGKYSRVNLITIADPRDEKPKNDKKFQISETEKNIFLSDMIWGSEEIDNIVIDKKSLYEEIYVTPSTEIETSIIPNWIISEDAGVQNLDESFHILYKDNKFPRESNFKDSTLADIKSINPESSSEFIVNYQSDSYLFPSEVLDASTKQEVASENEFSPKSEIFSKRSEKDKKYTKEQEKEILNVFKLLKDMKFGLKRLIEIVNKTDFVENFYKGMKKIEL